MRLKFCDQHVDHAANTIDAAMFSGATFSDPAERRALRDFMERWEKALVDWENTPEEDEEDED